MNAVFLAHNREEMRMKRIVAGFLSVAIGSIGAAALVATGVVGSPQATAPSRAVLTSSLAADIQVRSIQGGDLMRSVNKLNPFITRNLDGTLSLTAPQDVLATIPAVRLAALNQSLAAVNRQVRAGELTTAPGGFIQPAGANPLILSDGSTYIAYYWWGTSYCISNRDLSNAWWLGIYSAPFLGVIGKLNFWLGIGIVALLAEFVAVDQIGGWNGACANLLDNLVVTFTPQ